MKYSKIFYIFILMVCGLVQYGQAAPSVYKKDKVQKCQQDLYYIWHSKTYTQSGVYYDTVPGRYASDPDTTFYTLELTFTSKITTTRSFNIVKGGSIYFHGKTYNKAGTFKDTIRSADGCDTLINVIINWAIDYSRHDTVHVCVTDLPYSWNGKKLDHTGDYTDKQKSKDGHDSINYLNFNVHWPISQHVKQTICELDTPFVLGSRYIYKSGEYTEIIRNSAGCDDTIHVSLTIRPQTIFHREEVFCQSEGKSHKGSEKFYDRQIFLDTIPRPVGCDSIVETEYIPMPSYKIETNATCIKGGSYKWPHDGKIYTKEGSYYDRYSTVDGCDSTYVLHLAYSYENHVTIEACQGDTLFYKGKIVTPTTDFPIRDTLRTRLGADSILLVTYQFWPRYYFKERTTICAGDSVEWTGHTDMKNKPIILSKPGAYFDRKESVHGCDSIYEMMVTDGRPHNSQQTVVVCNDSLPYFYTDPYGQVHEWAIANADTTFIDTIGTTPAAYTADYKDGDIWYRALSGGCDSIWQLRIVTKDCGNDTVFICPNSSVWVNGTEYTSPGKYTQYFATESDVNAMDSICRYEVVEAPTYNSEGYDTARICASEAPYIWYSRQLRKSGKYDETLKTIHGCDSIVHLHLEVLPTYLTEEKQIKVCAGDSIKINNRIIRETCSFLDTMPTISGCDSVIRYSVLFVRSFFFKERDHFKKGESYFWHGHEYTKQGIYYDSCKTVDQCDSIYRLDLFEELPHHLYLSDSVCENDLPYVWRGRELYRDTIVYDSLMTVAQMDSIIELTLTVLPQYSQEQYIELCSGEEFTLNGEAITRSGTYVNSLITEHGCDSIIIYHINVKPTFKFEEEGHFKPNEIYEWVGHNMYLNKPGFYEDHYTTQNGCDSSYYLTLIQDYSFTFYDTVNICAEDTPYVWHGKPYYLSGTYYDVRRPSPDVKATYSLTLNINKPYLFESYIDLCKGGTYSFFGRVLTQPGTYEERLTSKLGCDSVYRVTINRPVSSVQHVQYTICPGEQVTIGDTIVYSACQFIRTYPSEVGCDSTVIYLVKELPSFKRVIRDTICEGETYIWQPAYHPAMILTKPGTYMDIYPIEGGCDSVFELHLVNHPISIWDTTIYVCPDEGYMYKGVEYFVSNVFTEEYTNRYGCDSLRNYHYNVMRYCSEEDNYLHCYGESVIIDGLNYVEDGHYRVPWNRDSLHRFNLASHPTYDYSKNIGVFCDSTTYEGETYYARGPGHTTFTVDRFMHTKAYGCDSTEHVTMSIYQSHPTVVYHQSIYDYSSVIFGNEYYSTSGVYTHAYHTSHGCDSTLILDLEVIPTDHPGALQYYYCALSTTPLTVFGKKYRPALDTTILDTVIIPYSDIKIVRKVNVSVEEAFRIINVEPENDLCATSDILFNIGFTHDGSLPKKYEIEFLDNDISATPKLQSGEIDPLSKSLMIQMSGQGSCVRPGFYPYRLKFSGDQCHLSDTIIEGEIMVRYPSSVMEANWTNVVALFNETANAGGWQFEAPYQWQIWSKLGDDKTSVVAPKDASQPYLYSNNLENGDRIIATLMRKGYKYAVPTCEFIFQAKATNEKLPTLVTPTIVKKSALVSIQAKSAGQYRLLDNMGNTYQTGIYNEGEQHIQMPAVSGCYLIQLINDNSSTETHRIIVL